ncbi:MAG TPA: type II toxin-antitoxin system PrlF family antitoxin [Solirubrobacterales bacterium]|nr:type II toxin-antitoxin system PrlF family antitoxin [Solirubrobacterales bacterium]
MITSRLTSKSQTTIPQPVRTALGLRAGDEVSYEIEGDRVVLKRARKPSAKEAVDDPFATFKEWHSEADQRAYADL